MKDATDRLRASREKQQQGFYERGREVGQQWAKYRAEPEQLDRLEHLKANMGDDWESCFDAESQSAWPPAQWLYFQFEPDCDGWRQEATDFWELVLLDDDKGLMWEPEFIRGFAEAAVAHWEESKP